MMHTLFSRRLALFTAAAALLVATGSLAGAASGTTRSSPQLKVALIAPSAHNDLAFTQSMYSALKSLQSKYNFKLSVSENEFVVADAANVMRQYASEGYNLIIAHGSQYGGTIQQLAPEFPKVSFGVGHGQLDVRAAQRLCLLGRLEPGRVRAGLHGLADQQVEGARRDRADRDR